MKALLTTTQNLFLEKLDIKAYRKLKKLYANSDRVIQQKYRKRIFKIYYANNYSFITYISRDNKMSQMGSLPNYNKLQAQIKLSPNTATFTVTNHHIYFHLATTLESLLATFQNILVLSLNNSHRVSKIDFFKRAFSSQSC